MAQLTQGGVYLLSTYDDFVEELRSLRGYRFELWPTGRLIPHELYSELTVPAYAIAWKSPSESLWSPASMLYVELGKPLFRLFTPSKIALQLMGLSKTKAEQIASAEREGIDHRSTLRQEILDCLGISDVPHIERRWLYKGRPIKMEGIGCPIKLSSAIKPRLPSIS